jgi:hypothetical protein
MFKEKIINRGVSWVSDERRKVIVLTVACVKVLNFSESMQ